MSKDKVAWGITGAGAFLRECVDIILSIPKERIDIFLSKAGEEVLKIYRLWDSLKGYNLVLDRSASSPSCGFFYSGLYSVLVVAPATSNTVAKMVCGIADTLITNIFAQAGKAGIPSIVLPTDVDEGLISFSPSGKKITLNRRKVDEDNISKLKEMEGVRIAYSLRELKDALRELGL